MEEKKWNYCLVSRHKVLYAYQEDNCCYSYRENKWIYRHSDIFDFKIGFDPSEPVGSPYRYGNDDRMYSIEMITKEEAEAKIGCKIDEELFKTIPLN